MFPFVDVTHFGAKGDGISDDSAAFQAAVDSIQGTDGRIVLVPEPPHEMDSPRSAGEH
jgi:polygalacturonase